MKILEKREIPGLARLYLAEFPGPGMRAVEFVDTVTPEVPKKDKWVLMISTQFGCPVGCSMCDAGAMGFHGNLSADQMLAQIKHALGGEPGLRPETHPKLKIHFARMGEPALNPAVLEALERLPAEIPSPGLMPSFSTVAPDTPEAALFMERLAGIKTRLYPGGNFQLQFSLHATDERKRREIIPVPVWSFRRVSDYGRSFFRPGDRKITLNFALPQGARLNQAEIAGSFAPELFLIKVTPINPTYTADSSGTSYVWDNPPEGLAEDAAALRAAGFEVILSPSTREEIEGETSCGQLWASVMKERASAAWEKEVEAVKGRELPFSPERSALLVVDMQEFFTDPSSPAFLPAAAPAVANAARLARAFRAAGRPVFFTSHAHADPAADGGLMTRRWKKVCVEGAPHSRITGALGAGEGEVIVKRRYSAFSGTDLSPRLKALGVDSLAVAGLKTDLCVESTVRAAFDLDFSCLAAGDACAADSPERHAGALKNIARGFGGVRRTSELEKLLKAREAAEV